MHFIIASLPLLNILILQNLFSALNYTLNQTIEYKTLSFVSFDSYNFDAFDAFDDKLLSFGFGKEQNYDFEKISYQKEYILYGEKLRDKQLLYSNSVGIVDLDFSRLFLKSDIACIYPIWFEVIQKSPTESQFIVTSNPLFARQLGFQHLSPVCGGQHIEIDFKMNSVSFSPFPLQPIKSDQMNSIRFLEIAEKAVLATLTSQSISESKVIVEYDPFYASSKLLIIVLQRLKMQFQIIKAQPLVIDVGSEVDDTFLRSLRGKGIE
jgi:hypothetical protein